MVVFPGMAAKPSAIWITGVSHILHGVASQVFYWNFHCHLVGEPDV
ncbi:MAG: hypothetical protein ABI475_10795 [Methylophilaceae bacterium]